MTRSTGDSERSAKKLAVKNIANRELFSAASGHQSALILPLILTVFSVAMLAAVSAHASNSNDLCRLATPATVGPAVHATVVRAEPPESSVGCEYSIKDTGANATTNHAISMAGAMNGGAIDPEAQKMLSAFGNTVLGNSSTEEKKNARHPGEVPALVFSIDDSSDARQELKMNRDAQSQLGPVTPIPGVGDEAFEAAGSIIMARKGNKMIRFIYTQCNCATKDIVPIAQKIAAAL
jgi:hypothetical protein